jgi:hypothetical protein
VACPDTNLATEIRALVPTDSIARVILGSLQQRQLR